MVLVTVKIIEIANQIEVGGIYYSHKQRYVANITWRYFYVLFYNVNYTHPYPKLFILKTYVFNM